MPIVISANASSDSPSCVHRSIKIEPLGSLVVALIFF